MRLGTRGHVDQGIHERSMAGDLHGLHRCLGLCLIDMGTGGKGSQAQKQARRQPRERRMDRHVAPRKASIDAELYGKATRPKRLSIWLHGHVNGEAPIAWRYATSR
jgi:hypothetical protein